MQRVGKVTYAGNGRQIQKQTPRKGIGQLPALLAGLRLVRRRSGRVLRLGISASPVGQHVDQIGRGDRGVLVSHVGVPFCFRKRDK